MSEDRLAARIRALSAAWRAHISDPAGTDANAIVESAVADLTHLAAEKTAEVKQLQRWLAQIQRQQEHNINTANSHQARFRDRSRSDFVSPPAKTAANTAHSSGDIESEQRIEDKRVSVLNESGDSLLSHSDEVANADSQSPRAPQSPSHSQSQHVPYPSGVSTGVSDIGSQSISGQPMQQRDKNRSQTRAGKLKETFHTLRGRNAAERQKRAAQASSVPFQDSQVPIRQGWLLKRKKREGKPSSWKRRWMVLNASYLYYFAAEGDAQPLGFFDCLTTTVKPAGREKSKNKESSCFDMLAVGRTYRFMHPTDDAGTMAWFTAIFEACQARVMDALGQTPHESSSAGGGASSATNNTSGSPARSFDRRTISYRKLLDELRQRPDNAVCAECSMPNPDWASLNLGVFICIECSGVHRSMGVHVSKVRSCTLDAWSVEEADRMGNAEANRVWEFFIPPSYSKPDASSPEGCTRPQRETFIRLKYEKKRFTKEANPDVVISGADASSGDADADGAKKEESHAVGLPASSDTAALRGVVLSPTTDAEWAAHRDSLLIDIDGCIRLIRDKLETPVSTFTAPADGMKLGTFVKDIRRDAASLRVPRSDVDGDILRLCNVSRSPLPSDHLQRLRTTLHSVLDEMYRRLLGSKHAVARASCARDVELVASATASILKKLVGFQFESKTA